MRTIAIEEHFLASGFREAMRRNAPSQRLGSNEAYMAERQAKLVDLGPTPFEGYGCGRDRSPGDLSHGTGDGSTSC